MEEGFGELLRWYIRAVKNSENEATKADRFRDFIRRAFPEIEVSGLGGFYPELDKYVGRDVFVKGKPDSLFGSLVIEFENQLSKKLEEAKVS